MSRDEFRDFIGCNLVEQGAYQGVRHSQCAVVALVVAVAPQVQHASRRRSWGWAKSVEVDAGRYHIWRSAETSHERRRCC